MATVVLGDNAYATLGGALASTASSLTFTSGHGARFPAVSAGQNLYACLLNSNNVLEEIQITTHTSGADSANIVRAIGGTTAKAWSAGDRIEARISSTAIRNLFADPLAVTGTGSSVIAGPLDISGTAAGQIVFPAVQVSSTATNVLDDYKEGPWTPTLTFATAGDVNVAYTARVGTYIKEGRLVTVNFGILTSTFTHTTAAGACRITGLPFTVENVTNYVATGGGYWAGITKANYTQVCARAAANTTYLDLYASGSAQGSSQVTTADMPTGGSVELVFTVTFEATA